VLTCPSVVAGAKGYSNIEGEPGDGIRTDENVPFVWKSGLATGLRKKSAAWLCKEVLDWIRYEQRGNYWKM
jgi:hypothetical protein